jgi:CheY-like chemotaxis protein
MRRILIFRESVRSKLSINFGEEVTFGEMFDSVSVEGSEIILYNIDNLRKVESFDIRFTEIINEHSAQKFDLIVIPAWLGNPLQYNGLNLAMHWRLSEKNTSRYAPILIYGFLDEVSVFKNCDFAGFLNSDNVSYKKLSIDLNKFINEIKIEEHANYDLKSNLKYFNVTPPTSYKTNHSIINEWSILQWSHALDIDKNDQAYLKIEATINSLLYYKYLRAKLSVNDSSSVSKTILKNKGKILFIDDEMEKGWELIFKKITSNFNQKDIHVLGKEFKGENSQNEIVKMILSVVKNQVIAPDVIVLDLRLHDSDYVKEKKITEVTGYLALKAIKEYNRGIQVIMLTASNKVWNMQALLNIDINGTIVGADGFIVKESPENSNDIQFTQRSLENIFCTIDECLIMSDLKLIATKIKKIKNLLSTFFVSPVNQLKLNLDFIGKTEVQLDVAYKLFDLSRNNSKYRNFAFLQLFQILESFADECFYMEPSKGYYIKTISQDIFVLKNTYQTDKSGNSIFLSPLKNNKGKFKTEKEGYQEELTIRKDPDTKFKVSALLIFVFGTQNSEKWNWDSINTIRNNYTAHGGKDNYIAIEHIENLLNILSNFFNPELQIIEKNLKYSILNSNKGNTPFDGLNEMKGLIY